MFFRTLALLCLCLVTPWVSAESPDHPLLGRYPGAEVKSWLYTEYEQIDVPSGPVDGNGDLPGVTLVGDLTRITYQVKSVSTLKVFRNYRNALDDAGATLVSVCELQDCGKEDLNAIDLATGVGGSSVVGNYYRKPYFIRAQLESERGSVHVVLFVGGFDGDVRVQQVVVEEVPEEKELISVAQDYLKRPAKPEPSTDQRTSEEKQQDHPMIARYPGASLAAQRSTEYEAVSIPVGVGASDGTPAEELDLTGDVYQYMYKADGVSTLKVYQNYLQAVTALGFSLDYSCELTECGSESASSDLGKSVSIRGIENFYRKPYYFVATRDTAQGRVVIALYFGGFEGDVWVQQTIVEEKGTRKDLVKVDADQLYQEISNPEKRWSTASILIPTRQP